MCTPVLEAYLPVASIYCALIWSCASIPFRWGWSRRATPWAKWILCMLMFCVWSTESEVRYSKVKHFWRLGCQCCFVQYICSSCAVLPANVNLPIGAYDLFLHSHKYIISHISLSVDQLWFRKWKSAMIPFFSPFLSKRRIWWGLAQFLTPVVSYSDLIYVKDFHPCVSVM